MIGQQSLDEKLLEAARNGNAKMWKPLIAQEANSNTQDGDGNTSLHLAIQNRRLQMVKLLLTVEEMNVNASGDIPLILAVRCYCKIAKFLLRKRIIEAINGNGVLLDDGVNYEVNSDDYAKYTDATEKEIDINVEGPETELEYFEIVERLTSKKEVDVNAAGKDGMTTLYWAIIRTIRTW